MLLLDKRVLVTGASGGIGAAIAKLFGREGASIGVHYRNNVTEATRVAEHIKTVGGKAALLKLDLLAPEAPKQLIQSFISLFGGLDILINNAGGCEEYVDFRDLSEDEWEKTLALNAKVPLWLSREAWPYMLDAGKGRIINISSVSVKYQSAIGLHYRAAKAALESVTLALAREGAKKNILVNAIRPGVIETSMYKKLKGYGDDRLRTRIAMIPIGRAGKVDEVAQLALFLASEGGSYITGEIIAVAGGD